MSHASGIFICAGLLSGAMCAAAQDAPDTKLKARELFYNTASAQAPAPTPAKPAAQTKSRSKAVAKTAPAPVATPAQSAPPVETAGAPAPVTSGGAKIVPATAFVDPPPAPPAPALGLKYTILKLVSKEPLEIAPDTVFRAGDRVQFSVEPNGPGFLYIVMQGSSGMWEPVFPSAKVANASNRVEGWRTYTMPPGSALVFDEQTGTEKIFIVLSRVEVPDLEPLMHSLRGGAKPASAPQDKPVPQPKTLVAGLGVDNDTVGRLRKEYARDLVIQPVDDDTPGRKEKAVYVVNPTGSPESRVVADIELVHK
jgi:hypothetical protein